MVNKLGSFLFSTRLMAVLFISFAIAMGIGTFIENEYNTDTARIIIYNAWWFEAIMLLFAINFIGNIKKYQLWQWKKWATLLLHLSFLLILLGAFVTRYISYEGMMPIREGETEQQFYSDRTYLTIMVDGDYQGEMKRLTFEEPILFSPVTNNDFTISENFAGKPFKIKYKDFTVYTRSKTQEVYYENAQDFYETAMKLWELRPFDKPVRLLGLSLSNLNTQEKKNISVQLKIPFEEFE